MITPLEPDDLPRILEIEKRSYPRPWSDRMFLLEFANPLGIRFGFRTDTLVGYVFGWMLFEDLHINNLAVDPAVRRSGIGRALLDALMTEAAKQQCQDGGHRPGGRATLEVRPSNVSALALYKKCGFLQVAVRQGYYEDTGEDAIILGRNI